MKKFMLIYTAPVLAEDQMAVSPEEMAKGMAPWMDWFSKCGDAIVDGGAPLTMGARMTSEGWAKPISQSTGYSIIQAEDMEGAKALLADHPYLMLAGAGIEIFEITPMPGM